MFDVVGQDFAKMAFKTAFKNNRISHAYIIEGEDGTGKSIFAQYMASCILCSGDVKPCSVCPSCLKIKDGNHPDVKVISRTGKSIGIDMVRNIIDEINVKPYEGNKKIIIVKNADSMTEEAQNAFLKTIEEAPYDTVIILLAEDANLLLSTIRSRCQTLRFLSVPEKVIYENLIKLGYDDAASKTASKLSSGNFGKALLYFDDDYVKHRGETIDIAQKLVRLNRLESQNIIDFFVKNKENINDVLNTLLFWFRDAAVLKFSRNEKLIVNSDYIDRLIEDAGILTYNKLYGIINSIKDAYIKLKQNSNYQMTFEVMLLNIQEEYNDKSCWRKV